MNTVEPSLSVRPSSASDHLAIQKNTIFLIEAVIFRKRPTLMSKSDHIWTDNLSFIVFLNSCKRPHDAWSNPIVQALFVLHHLEYTETLGDNMKLHV